jgi:opacity protein-like surface antigen
VYWRLDVGWSKTNDAGFKDRNFAADGVVCADSCSVPGKVDGAGDSYVVGAGIGYRFSAGVRGDLTLTYRGDYGLSGSAGTSTAFKSDITSTAVLVNAYYDLPAGTLQPYLGAGVGYARNEMDPVVQRIGIGTFMTPGGRSNNAVFALMAGVGIPVSGRIVLDVGYRYIDLGKIESGAGTASAVFQGFPTSFPYSGAKGKLTAHEVTVGLRF